MKRPFPPSPFGSIQSSTSSVPGSGSLGRRRKSAIVWVRCGRLPAVNSPRIGAARQTASSSNNWRKAGSARCKGSIQTGVSTRLVSLAPLPCPRPWRCFRRRGRAAQSRQPCRCTLPDQGLKSEMNHLRFLALAGGREGRGKQIVVQVKRGPHADDYGASVCIRRVRIQGKEKRVKEEL